MSHEIIEYPLSKGKTLLEEGDVLLYRGTGIIAKGIQKVTKGRHSHVAIASQTVSRTWEAVQFREFKGALAISLKNDIVYNKSVIDVYRPIPFFTSIRFDPEVEKIELSKLKFDGRKVTDCMRSMTGRPYSYSRIYFLWRYYTRFWKDWTKEVTNDLPLDELIYPVCSTAVAHCFNKNGYDLIKNRSDEYMAPANIAESTRLNYLFSLYV